jgi:hypothetical protein
MVFSDLLASNRNKKPTATKAKASAAKTTKKAPPPTRKTAPAPPQIQPETATTKPTFLRSPFKGTVRDISLSPNNKYPNRIFTAGSVTGEMHLYVSAPIKDHSAYAWPAIKMVMDNELNIKEKLNISDVLPRCTPHDPDEEMPDKPHATATPGSNLPCLQTKTFVWFEFIRILNNPETNTKQNRTKWANRVKAWLNQVSKQHFKHQATFVHAGDITPPSVTQPLGDFITTKDVFKIMQMSYSTIPLEELIKDDVILGAYFGDNRVEAVKKTYNKLTTGNYDGQNNEESAEDDVNQLSDFED